MAKTQRSKKLDKKKENLWKNDKKWMNYAVKMAKLGWGMTNPNPLVGAVIIKDEKIIGKGWHHKAGENHAEVNAIMYVKEHHGISSLRSIRGATLYVTLEPCSTQGRTPPCTDAIITSGIKRVVIGTLDSNPKNAGRGVSILKEAGIEVVTGIEEVKCLILNEAYYKWMRTKQPMVLLKLAMTLDGKIATAKGKEDVDSKWITGKTARQRVHRLRQWADAIIVGAETVRNDRPALTARDRKNKIIKEPRRLVASRELTAKELKELMPAGKKPEIIRPETADQWKKLIKKLGSEKVVSVLIEGGGELAESALKAKIVDKVEFHIAPKILGGRNSRPVIAGDDPDSLENIMKIKNLKVSKLGEDICISGEPA